MKIIDLAIRNRVAVVVLAVLLSFGGLVAYLTIPKESIPQIEFATIVVTTIYPGASPDDIESIITQEIEREVTTINGIDELRSISTEGVSTVIVEFLPSVDVKDAKQEVREAVERAKAEFPTEVEEPVISEIDTSEFPVVNVNLAAEYSLARLRDVAEDLRDEVESVPGVLEVMLVGGLEREVQVDVDLAALQGYNLTFDDVVNAIRSENTNIPGGSIDIDRLNYLVRVDGEIRDPEEIAAFVVKAPGRTPVYVRDVAEVRFGFKERSSYARLEVLQEEVEDGVYVPVEHARELQVVTLIVKKQPGENILETVARVRAAVEAFPLPSGTEVSYVGDASEDVRALVKDLENNIIAGLLFVISVLLFFLGVRNSVLVGIAIPLSMFVSFLVFAAMGQTLNFIMLFSLIIALGMLVDNAIVIIENIYRYREEGHPRWEAARLGAGEVGMAVASSTATTVAAFAPMLLWPGIIGRFMSYLPLTLIVTLSASLFVALVINPVVTGYLVRLEGEGGRPPSRLLRGAAYALAAFTALVVGLSNWRTLAFAAVAIPLVVAVHRFVLGPFSRRFQERTVPRLTQRYRDFLGWVLERDYAPRRALLRNTFALGSFSAGFVLLALGLALSALSEAAGLLALVPGGLLLALGILGILLHALESMFLGRGATVKAGLLFGAVLGGLSALLLLGGRIEDPAVVVALLALPAAIVAAGALGVAFGRGRERLILTDNRARLLTGVFAFLIAIIGLFALAPTGVVFFPETDPGQVQITLEAPLGTNVEASNAIAEEAGRRIRALLAEQPASAANVENILTSVGVGGDVFFGGGATSAERSRITLNMVDYAARAEPSNTTLGRLRERLAGIPGVTTTITKEQMGPPTGAPVNLEITGKDFGQIVAIASDVKQRLERGASVPGPSGRPPLAGLVDITDDLDAGRPELRVRIDRERAAAFGLSTAQIASTVRAAIQGIEASKYRTGKNEYDVTVRLREADRRSLEALQSLTVPHEGRQVPLVAVAHVEMGSGLGAITRKRQQRVVTVQGEAAAGVNGNELLARVQAELAPYVEALPPGYSVRYTGESEDQQESFGFLFTVLLIALGLISMILIAQFNSVKNPLIIMVATGLSLIGVLLGLVVTRTPFGLFTFIGVISLAGIVVNNAIVLVDYIEQLRFKHGVAKHEAVVEGGATRLRPVLLTAFTTVIGLIPLTFGINIDFVGLVTELRPNFQFGSENTQFWGPMGTAIISGLTFATFLTLVIVPVMYSTFDSIAMRFSRDPEPRPAAPEDAAEEEARDHVIT